MNIQNLLFYVQLYPRERPGTHCIGGWVPLGAGQDGCRKSRLPPGFDSWTSQPIASPCTYWAIPAYDIRWRDEEMQRFVLKLNVC